MAEEHKITPPDGAQQHQEQDDDKIPIRLILLGLLGLYILLFVILNAKSVTVSFVFFSSRISLIVGLVLAIVLGFAGGYLTNELRARRKRKTAS